MAPDNTNSNGYVPYEESRTFLVSEARKMRKFSRHNTRAEHIKQLVKQLEHHEEEIEILKANTAALYPDSHAQNEAEKKIEVKVSKIAKDLHESLEQLGYYNEEGKWLMLYAPLEESQTFVKTEVRKKGVSSNDIVDHTADFDEEKIHEFLEKSGYSFTEGKWIQVGIHHGGHLEVMTRQKFQCYNCNRPGVEEGFPPPNQSDWKFDQIEPGKGYHSYKQCMDYGNTAGYCKDCIQDRNASQTLTIRVKDADKKKYTKWMEEKKWEKNTRGTYNFNSFTKKALDSLIYGDYVFPHEEYQKLNEYEDYAHSFKKILNMYNEKKNDWDFAEKITHFFQFYIPLVGPIESDEDIDSRIADEGLRKFVKGVRDEEMRKVIKDKGAGYRNYETYFDEYEE